MLEENEIENENFEEEELYKHLYNLYNFSSEELFKKNYKAIKLGYLLALLD